VQLQRVPYSVVPTMPEHPSTQATSLEEIINRVSRSVEATKKEFEGLTSWLLHRGEHERKEIHESISCKKGSNE
jgi:hypothetical protein